MHFTSKYNTINYCILNIAAPPEEVGEVYPRPLLPQEEHHYQETCTSPEPKNKKMLQFIKRMSFYNKDLHKRLTKVTKERNYYREEIKKYQEIINKLRNELDNVRVECQENVSKALSKTFTKNQTQYFVSNKHILKWEEEDISKALTLRSLSPKAYRFLRKHWKFPLPSPATISKWVSKVVVEPGILCNVIQLLAHYAPTMCEYERICVLSFDESAVAQAWSYDSKNDNIYEPKRSVQCAMLRGLLKPWKQLVFYDFDCDMTKNILDNIIHEVETAGFIVAAIVSDLGPKNLALWKQLNINVNNSSFPNPFECKRPVFVFADVPHLIKLIRNNLLDHGFTLDGQLEPTVTNSSIRELIIRSTHDLKTIHRLSYKHIDVQGPKRMNVLLAAQLLSQSTAKSIEYFGRKGLLKSKDWEDTSNFISLVDAWFDVFNAKTPHGDKGSRASFGMHLESQTHVLNKMLQTIRNMKVGGKNSMYPFQKGVIVSSQSLLGLYEFLRNKFGVTYIITYRLNQDCLEHMFGYLRQMGACYQHPSPLQLKYRIRSFLLGRNCELVGSNYNITKVTQDNSLSEGPLPVTEHCDSDSDTPDIDTLESELMLSAMLFSSDSQYAIESKDESNELHNLEKEELEESMETEGLRYVGGFIAHKFPKYSYLGTNVNPDDKTWIGKVCRRKGKLMTPSNDLFEQLRLMEKLFEIYHGKKSLKSGRKAIKKLSTLICKRVNLPEDVVHYFVRCRVYFRIRILNREIERFKKMKYKLSKHIR